MKNQRGITLVALIITIIVLLILSGIVISTITGNESVIKNADEAVVKYNNKVDDENKLVDFAEKYIEVEGQVEKWIQKKTKVIKLKKDGTMFRLNVGDTIAYDETNNGAETGLKDVEWQVLGAENGELLIMSTDNIETKTLTGIDGCANGITELNGICEAYGNGSLPDGEKTTGARCIKVDDINRITGYNPNSNGQGKKYGEGKEYEYGIQKVFEKNSQYFDFETHEWVVEEDKKTLRSNYYSYYPTTLTESSSDPQIGLLPGSKEYKLLFNNSDNTVAKYWLASEFTRIFTKNGYSNYGLRCVEEEEVQRAYLIEHVTERSVEAGVRAVVTFSAETDIK